MAMPSGPREDLHQLHRRLEVVLEPLGSSPLTSAILSETPKRERETRESGAVFCPVELWILGPPYPWPGS